MTSDISSETPAKPGIFSAVALGMAGLSIAGSIYVAKLHASWQPTFGSGEMSPAPDWLLWGQILGLLLGAALGALLAGREKGLKLKKATAVAVVMANAALALQWFIIFLSGLNG